MALSIEEARKIDCAIAEKVMGLRVYEEAEYLDESWDDNLAMTDDKPTDYGVMIARIPNYSTDIAAAWTVMERLCELGFIYAISPHTVSLKQFGTDDGWEKTEGVDVPHAICLAALKDVGVEI